MGLAVLILGLVIFLGAHVFVTMREASASAIAASAICIASCSRSCPALGLALIIWGFARYRAEGWIEMWSPPNFMRHITIGLSWFAVVLVLAAYLPGHIKAKTKHPMLAGIKIWAFAHLLSNGDLGSIILFGSFLAWAVYARIAAKKREALGDITRVGMADRGWANDAIAVGLGTVLYLALAYVFHPAVIGVPVFRA